MAGRRARRAGWGGRRVIVLGLLLALGAGLAWSVAVLIAESGPAPEQRAATNPRADYWRQAREGQVGTTAVSGLERGVLIDNGGQNWRQLRNGPLAGLSPWWLGFVLLGLLAFYLYRGPARLEHPRSGAMVPRWSRLERWVHWLTTVVFLALSLTGLTLLFGRAALLPLLGLKRFAAVAEVAKDVHNYLGPIFAVLVLLMIVMWIRDNIPNKTDWEWFKKGGGLVKGGAHPSAGRINGGEKLWFWTIATVGVAVVVSGFVLDFPNFGQTRATMQLAHLVHAALAVVWISFAFGHIYIGTVGTEGALEGMVKGRVSVEWARQHHDLWYHQLLVREARSEGSGSPAGSPEAAPPGRRA